MSAVSLDKRFLISGTVNVHETGTGRLLTAITGGRSPISFSPGAKTVLTISYDAEKKISHRQSYLSIRKIDNGEEVSAFQVPEGIREIVWSPDGKTMAIVGLTFNTRLFDVVTGRENGIRLLLCANSVVFVPLVVKELFEKTTTETHL